MSTAADTAHSELTGDLLGLSKIVDSSEIIAATSAEYADNAEPWSAAKDKHPRLVLRPNTVESLSKMVTYLANTELDYKVRSCGFGSSSATDVLISLSAFDDFEFNQEEKYVILGTGNHWRSYYERMDKVVKDWAIVSVRSPSIGVGGSTLASGFSWLSSELGTVADPSNLMDVRVVTADGQIKWASEDPELLWAMRGTAGGFAIATHFKIRAHHFPENGRIWGGPIMIPRNKVPEAAKGISSMIEKDKKGEISEKTAIFVYVMRAEQMAFIGVTEDVMVVHAYDGRGEKAGREAFRWALEIDGAIDQTRGDLTIADMSRMQDGADALRGKSDMYWSPMALTDSGEDQLTDDVIVKSFEWWSEMAEDPTSVGTSGWLLFELFSCKDSSTGRDSTGWPRPVGYKHMVLLGTGCAANSGEELRERARQYILDGPKKILGKPMQEVDIVPNGLEDFHNIERVYGDHYEKLRLIKTRVDPKNRLQGWIRPYTATER